MTAELTETTNLSSAALILGFSQLPELPDRPRQTQSPREAWLHSLLCILQLCILFLRRNPSFQSQRQHHVIRTYPRRALLSLPPKLLLGFHHGLQPVRPVQRQSVRERSWRWRLWTKQSLWRQRDRRLWSSQSIYPRLVRGSSMSQLCLHLPCFPCSIF